MNNFSLLDLLSHVFRFGLIVGVLFGALDFIVSAFSSTESDKVFHQADFDLSSVIALMNSDKVSTLAELAAQINDPTTGLNNVDMNGDNIIDYIEIEEKRDEDVYRLTFLAHPSQSQSTAKLPVAALKIQLSETVPQKISISGGFPDYVVDNTSAYYQVEYVYKQQVFWHTFFAKTRSVYTETTSTQVSKTKQLSISDRNSRRKVFYALAGIALLKAATRPATYRIQSRYSNNFKLYRKYTRPSTSFGSYGSSSPSSRGSGYGSRSRGYSSGK